MASLLTEVVIESTDPQAAAAFYAAALGWELQMYQPGDVPWVSASGDSDAHDLKLVFVMARDPDLLRNRLYVNAYDIDVAGEVERLVQLGADKVGEATAAIPVVRLRGPGGVGLSMLAERIE